MSTRKAAHFRLLGIRPLNPIDTENFYFDYDRANSIHKALIGRYEWFMFYTGIYLSHDSEYIEVNKDAKMDLSLYDTDTMKISISAIVGRNGSGKSSIVELIVRAINNLSAVLQGEGYNYSKAEHLHYIDDVYVELLFQIERKYYILSVKGRHLSIKTYSWISFYKLQKESENVLLSDKRENCRLNLLQTNNNGVEVLRKFFYTFVCNYSLYGFNYRDFGTESTPKERLIQLGINVKESQPSEDASWLKGLFHKNDGYQTPIVLHPIRVDGQLDIIRENKLAKERMLSMLFYKDEGGDYPMRTINGNLMVSEIKYYPAKNRKFAYENIRNSLGVGPRQNLYQNIDQIYKTEHILDKGNCPLVSLSLYNFVPSCGTCNGPDNKGSNTLGRSIEETILLSPTTPLNKFAEEVTFSVLPSTNEIKDLIMFRSDNDLQIVFKGGNGKI